jgi:ABC-type glycerol-3-phosphate transport system substrate-binding protein
VRRVALSAAAAALSIAVAACATDREPEHGTSTAATETGTPSPSPSGSTTGTHYPAFGPENYTFRLVVTCFCAGAGVPIQVTVVEASVADASYAADGGGVTAGEPAGEVFRLSINDVIDAASDPTVDHVDVDWPDGQDYPTSVHVDRAADATDDDVIYAISDVQLN